MKELATRLRILSDDADASIKREDHKRADEIKQTVLELQEEYTNLRAEFANKNHIEMIVTGEDIAQLMGQITGIPVAQLEEAESERLLRMEGVLHERVIGQEEAITSISDAIRRARAGLKDPQRPIGTFLFLGPTGVGKTELAKTLAAFMFDDEEAMIRLDSGTADKQKELQTSVDKALRGHFRPEFLNRIDEVIIFEPLTKTELLKIVDLILEGVQTRLSEKGVSFTLSAEARTALVEEGYDPEYGARPLRRTVEQRIENELARRLLKGEISEHVQVDYVDGAYVVQTGVTTT